MTTELLLLNFVRTIDQVNIIGSVLSDVDNCFYAKKLKSGRFILSSLKLQKYE
jgi:hypothetical protein